MRIPRLTMIWVEAPNSPFSFGGAISDMYIGTTTRLAPEPMPEMSLPKHISPMFGAKLWKMGPIVWKRVVRRSVKSRPYRLQHVPAARAPNKPPRVYIEETMAN